MEAIKKLLGAYLIGVAMVVAVWFIINTFFIDSFNVSDVWYVLDVLMLVGLVIALVYTYDRKRRDADGASGEGISRKYLEANVAFYLTAFITILFLHNWFDFLAQGEAGALGLGEGQMLNHQAWVIWAFVDTLLPLALGTTGCAMLKGSSK